MNIAVLKERVAEDGFKSPGRSLMPERRVALTPAGVSAMVKRRRVVRVEAGAGLAAGYDDASYRNAGAEVLAHRDDVLQDARIVLRVRVAHAAGGDEPDYPANSVVIGFADPYDSKECLERFASTGASLLALELVPRITRAQSMDALSSQASIAGYQAVLIGASQLPRIFPMMMTAAGTVPAARVFVIGAGVAGLQAIATAKRLGASVQAFDIRPAVKEHILSLGAKFVSFDVGGGEGTGGYAKELTPEQQQKQRQLMGDIVASSDLVITTALVPGRPAPSLVDTAAVERMPAGGVVVDLAAERGGNCQCTKPGEVVRVGQASVIGCYNYPSLAAGTASHLLSGNMVNLLNHLIDEQGGLKMDASDEITASMTVCRDRQIVHPKLRELFYPAD